MTSLTPYGTSVAMYGTTVNLLETRTWILQEENFVVICASNYAAAENLIFRQDIGYVILCHSVAPADRDSLRAALRELRPWIKCLLLVRGASTCLPTENESIVNVLHGPRELILSLKRAAGIVPDPILGTARLVTFLRG